MHIVTLRTVGGSTMVAIPKAILEGLGLAANAKVGLRIDRGRLVVEPRPKPRYVLGELLAVCDPAAPPAEEDKHWDAAAQIGREVL